MNKRGRKKTTTARTATEKPTGNQFQSQSQNLKNRNMARKPEKVEKRGIEIDDEFEFETKIKVLKGQNADNSNYEPDYTGAARHVNVDGLDPNRLSIAGIPIEELNRHVYRQPHIDLPPSTWPEKNGKVREKEGEMEIENDKREQKSPAHYGARPVQPIMFMVMNFSHEGFVCFLIGNILKYVDRAPGKGGLSDYEKGQVYMDWLVEYERTGSITVDGKKYGKAGFGV